MIKVNGSRLESAGYQFGLKLSDGKMIICRSYKTAIKARVAFGGELQFRELWATEWTEASDDVS